VKFVNKTQTPLQYLRPLLLADFIALLRNRRAVLVSILLPMALPFAAGNQKAQFSRGGSIVVMVLAVTLGLLSLAIMGYASSVSRDRERGIFQRLRVTPAPTWTIMVSRLLVQVVVGFVIAVAVLTIGSHMNHVSLNSGEYANTVLVAILESGLFLSIAQALVGLVKSAAMVNSPGSLLFVALALSGLWGVSGTLGSSFQSFAKWMPVGTVIPIFQSALHQMAWNRHTTLSLLACFGYIAVCLFIGIKWFKWEA
jgi:ABC-2 type transport system permease protein